MTKNLLALALTLILLTPTMFPQPTSAAPAQTGQALADFDRLVDEYFAAHFQSNPTEATSDGFHQYDSKLEDYSRAGVDREIAGLRDFQGRFARVRAADLPPDTAADLELLRHQIKGQLLELESIRMWEKDPDRYSSGISNSVFVIMSRNFAPPEERLRSVMARERQMPAVFDAARHNLHDPPRIYTQVALEQLPDIIGFFRKDVPQAFGAVKDRQLLAEFHASNQAVIEALRKYESYLRQDLLPASKGDFQIGADNFSRKLQYEEMVDIPLDQLLQIGYADLRRNQQELKRVAAQIDSRRSPQQVLAELQQDHPAPDQLLSTFRGLLGSLRDFIQARHIMTIPSPAFPIVEETPPFERALTFASMDTPGAYERKAKEAFFNVTLPQPGWSQQRVQEHMAGFNRGTIISTAVHEVYPGHYMQFLWLQAAPSKVRKLIYVNTNSEGWAHYCEQMMLDEGYGNGDSKLRLGQIEDALLRDARYIVGLQMHTGKMTYEQGIAFFMKEGYQTRDIAERETMRGTRDPTYLVYTLGKLQIMKLRQDYRQRQGAQFSLQRFHDEFMKQGGVPIKIIRQAMLGDDSPVL